MIDLKGRVAIVTGAKQGIGLEISRTLASRGCAIAMLDLNFDDQSAAEGVAKEFAVQAKGYGCNVAQSEPVEATFKQVIADFGKVDFLVNNAGITRDNLLMRMTDDEFDSVLAVNLRSVFVCTRAIVRHFLKNKYGRIVNMASINGLRPPAGQANYGASKAAVIGITQSNAKEFGAKGITVNAVAPGFIITAMTDKLAPETRDAYVAAIPLKAMGTTKDVANAVAFLVSPESAYITGQVLSVDGGLNA